jgi:hypothetical protein
MSKKVKRIYKIFDSNTDSLNFEFSYNTDETFAIHERVNNNPEINIDDLRRISLWKINRILFVSDDVLKKLSALAEKKNVSVDDRLVKEIIDDLVNSQGIGFPMASAILKFIKPNTFPIIDVRAYRALTGKKLYYSSYNYEKYIKYTKELMRLAKLDNNRPLREMDEQLYCFDESVNGNI